MSVNEALIFGAAGGGAAEWGKIGGDIADQIDLNQLFQQKVNLPSQVTVTDAAPVIASLADNADYVFSTALTGLTVTAIAVEGVTTLRFTVGAANLTPSFPASLVFTGNSPTFKAGKTYICAVTPLGSGHIMAWSEAVSAS